MEEATIVVGGEVIMRTKTGCCTSGAAVIQEACGWYCMIRGGLIVVAGFSDPFIFLQA